MAIATLQVLAHGTRVEDAALLGRHPWHLTQTPAPPPARTQRIEISVFRQGLTPLRRLCLGEVPGMGSGCALSPPPHPPFSPDGLIDQA